MPQLRVSVNTLLDQPGGEFGPLYVLHGSEVLLVEEALDQIRARARAHGFSERLRYTVEPGFDWNQIFASTQSMSLFAEKRLIELRLPTGKPGDVGGRALIAYTEIMNSDTSLILICGAIDRRSQNTRWFKAMDEHGVIAQCPTIGSDRLADWIGRRMSASGLKYDEPAVQALCTMVEGNLLAAAQEINLLALLYADETITSEHIASVIADHARFNVYALVDACLEGATHRVSRILESLRGEVDAVIVLWAIGREVRTLCQISHASEHGGSMPSLFRKYGIWSSRSALVAGALRRLSTPVLENLLRRVARMDLMAKGNLPPSGKDVWHEIECFACALCGHRL